MLLDWLRTQAATGALEETTPLVPPPLTQANLFLALPYQEESPAITSEAELAGALEHLEYAIFRRYNNQLTRAERARLDNTIDNALFKVERFLRLQTAIAAESRVGEVQALRDRIRDGRDRVEKQRTLARRADLKLAQLAALTPESFEEFVAELFESLGYEVDQVGGSGDEGADLQMRRRDGTVAVVQCKYHKKSVVGSPELQRFLGTIHHTGSHKGFFVTTSTFSLAAEKFAALHPIELVDGTRLVELVSEAVGSRFNRDTEPALF
jgi:restriction system protein